MKKLMLSTALVAATSVPVFAQNADELFRAESSPEELHATNFIGMRVYRADEVDAEAYEGVQEGWDDIGEINDVVFSRDGQVEAVLVDIGGFLGMGENQVAVDMDAISFVADSATADEETDFFLVMNAPRGALEEAPTYGAMGEGDATATDEATASDAGAVAETEGEATAEAVTDDAEASGETDMAADTEVTEEETDTAVATDATEEGADVTAGADATEEGADVTAGADATEETDMAAETDATAETDMAADTDAATGEAATAADATDTEMSDTAAISREGYVTADNAQLTADDLTGATAYDANDERVGDVADLLMAEDGKIEAAIVDVGGFLGIGAKSVALEMSKLDILRSEDGGDVRVYVTMTEEELEALPEYEN